MSETGALRALMEADRWIERVTGQRSHLPEITELAALEEALRALLVSLRTSEGALAPLKASYDVVATESLRLKTRANDLDVTLASSTANARELTALQHELTHVRTLLSENEDRELELLLEVEPVEAQVAAIKARAQPQVQRRGALQEAIAQLQATLDDELVALRAGRTQRATALSMALLSRYDAALRRSGTSGAAQVVEGRCDGCRIALSPLDVDRWKAQPPGSYLECPECGRLLLP